MSFFRARLYIGMGVLSLVLIVGAAYSFFVGYWSSELEAPEYFHFTLAFFIASIFLTELRIFVGGRSARNKILALHVCSSIPYSVLLVVLSFFYTKIWLIQVTLMLFIVVLLSGGILWFRGMRNAASYLKP